MRDTSRGLAVAVLSGVLSYVACLPVERLGARWGAGIVFGALVLAPSHAGVWNRGVAIALSTAVYRAAVWLADALHVDAGWHAVLACSLAGVAGAIVLSVASRVALHSPSSLRATASAAGAGVVAGALIGLSLDAPDESLVQRLLLIAGFVVWQAGYTAAHGLTPWSKSSARNPDVGG